MNDSYTMPFIMSNLVTRQRCNGMPHPILGLMFVGLVVRTLIAAVIIVAILWLVLKLGRLADAYTAKLRREETTHRT
jgi:hypothetical protein